LIPSPAHATAALVAATASTLTARAFRQGLRIRQSNENASATPRGNDELSEKSAPFAFRWQGGAWTDSVGRPEPLSAIANRG